MTATAATIDKPEITLDHIRRAAEWAITARDDPQPIDGLVRKYRQSEWDCGTACCMWGAASIIAGCGATKQGPQSEWSGVDLLHTLIAGVLRSSSGTPEQIAHLLTRATLAGATLAGATLAGAWIRLGNVIKKLA